MRAFRSHAKTSAAYLSAKSLAAYPFSTGLIALIAAVCLIGCWSNNNNIDTLTAQSTGDVATAEIRGYTDNLILGTVTFTAEADSLLIEGSVSGLIPGQPYALHLRQFGNCTAPDSSGEHFGAPLESHGNPLDSLARHHRGDLPNLATSADGVGSLRFKTMALSLSSGDRSVVGRSVVVDAQADDFVTQPEGNSGAHIACGVIGDVVVVKDTTGNKGLPSHPY